MEQGKMLVTRCYRITGIVQGVGFRPYVHKLTKVNNLKGWVLNDSEGVLLEVQGKPDSIDAFVLNLSETPPPLSKILNIIEKNVKDSIETYTGFEIRKSVSTSDTKTIVPPDSFVCQDCVNEMLDPTNRRYQYPFINCTNCGPRYSIIEKMPYDRSKTTMKHFTMCEKCDQEYLDIENRRYHAQPNACNVCGPTLIYKDRTGKELNCLDPIPKAIKHLREGRILAIKSVGGFHLAVDAQNEAAVKELRKRKRRDSKPFALMVKNLAVASAYAVVGEKQSELLESPQRPIVLLTKRERILPESIAPFNPNYGIMLPSAPVHYLLLETPELPVLVMTSANISGQPIVIDNEDAIDQLSDVADYLLMNNRDIYTRVDDSLIRHSQLLSGEEIITFLRRSKGYAPYPVTLQTELRSVLALGSELKNVVAISKGHDVYLSQHIGDLKNDEIYEAMKTCSEQMQDLFDIEPEAIAIDLHPQFRTAEILKQSNKQVHKVQHHHAHMASCMAENNLDRPVIGAIFDGTGYGLDGTIWGGEFLIGDYGSFRRCGHLYPFYLLGGDKAVEEPFRTAVSLLHTAFGDNAGDIPHPVYQVMSHEEKHVFLKMADKKINAFQTTSMGRLFDGISSLIGLCHRIEYEAQAAIELEGILGKDLSMSAILKYAIQRKNDNFILDHRPMIRDLVQRTLVEDLPASILSRMFHSTIVKATVDICGAISDDTGIKDVVLSGGVLMNEFISCNLISELRGAGLNAYCQQIVPPNDGGIALGQLMIANEQLKRAKK